MITSEPLKSVKQSELIREWIEQTEGWFSTSQLDRDLGIQTPRGKGLRRVVLKNLCDAGVLMRDPTKYGIYRSLHDNAPMLQWQEADVGNVLNLVWPFNLHKFVRIYPKNLIVIAGAPNAGKTAFCFDFIRLNMDKWPISYFTSEMGAEEMKVRLTKFPNLDISNWKFEARERTANFSDVIYADKINIIDYLEVVDNFYLVAQELAAMFNRLNKGIAIVALQKKKGVKLGRGAEFSLEKPRLYLSMDAGLLQIIKAKNWVDQKVNPNGLAWSFHLVDGCRFVNIQESEPSG